MNKLAYLVASIAVLGVFTTSVFARDIVNVSGASGVALDGYDPVAFFLDKKPMNGDPDISATHNGAKYFFASKEHKTAFETDPQKYVPQFGGYCAFGVAVGALFPVDINTWQIKDGKLYLNLNPAVLNLFNKDPGGYIAKAEKNWPDLVMKNTK
jgi:YHS domain-containing protein